MSNAPSRRQFLQAAGTAAAAGLLLPSPSRAADSNAKLQLAVIGSMGMGFYDRRSYREDDRLEIVALCDVDSDQLAKAKADHPDARTYTDWREMLATEGDRIDAVSVSIPDHMHAAVATEALLAGKHVYCQKPMCHDVAEVRALTKLAAKSGLVTQLGTQGAAYVGDRRGVQWLREGRVGKVTNLYLCSNRPGAIASYRLPGPRPAEAIAPPEHLNWDLWLGTAPERSYAPSIYHRVRWRAWQDFGTGWLGDIGCHIFDAVWKGLELTAPTSVIADVQKSWQDDPARRADTWPQSDHITWKFPGNQYTAGEELTVEWHDGKFYAPPEVRALIERDDYPAESALVVGTEGALLIEHGGKAELFPSEKFKDVARPELEEKSHYRDFVSACLSGGKAASDFSISGPMTETILLGTVAIRVPDTELQWDADAMRFTNNTDANALLRRTYRKGWEVPGV